MVARNANCAFLQGAGTSQEAVAKLSRAIAAAETCQVEILNYRKNGAPFVNYLTLKPVFEALPERDAAGERRWRMAFFIGLQFEVNKHDPPTKVLKLDALIKSLPSDID